MKNASYDTHDVKKCCEGKLGIVFRDGKEFNGWAQIGEKKVARITVPKGRKSIPPGTYKSMAEQLRLTIQQFDQLLDCSIWKEEFDKILTPI